MADQHPDQSPGPASRPTGPAPGAAASSPASGPASATSEPPGFIADAGPRFDPEAAAEAPLPPVRDAEVLPPPIEWEQDTVEALLRLQGRALHAGIGVAEEDWRYTELDLAAIAPPLTRIANRYEPVQRLARHADPLVLLFALGGYGVRSLEERAAVLRELEPADVESIDPLEEGEGVPINARPAAPRPEARQYAAPAPPPAPAPVDPSELEWQTGDGR